MTDKDKILSVLNTFGGVTASDSGIRLRETEPGFYRIYTTRPYIVDRIRKEIEALSPQYMPDIRVVREVES